MNDNKSTTVSTYTKASLTKASLCVGCVICGDSVPLTPMEEAQLLSSSRGLIVKVCDKCRSAIMFIRAQREEKSDD